ncbi:MAG: hypothetical protein QM817_27940 [Archangium sp.]
MSRRFVFALVFAVSASCTCQKNSDGTFNPKHASVSCSVTACTRPVSGRSQQGTCAANEECVKTRCTTSECSGWRFAGDNMSASRCDANGCCTFVCNGFAGYSCPPSMSCQRDDGARVADMIYECER